MDGSSKYGDITFGNNNGGNINIENNGILEQKANNQSSEIENALKEIETQIKSLPKNVKEEMEDSLELLKTHITSKDPGKINRQLTKLGKLLGHSSSIITIASFFGVTLPIK